jgi:hypothetical protein
VLCAGVCGRAGVYVGVHTYVFYACMCAGNCVYMHACMLVCMYVCTYVSMHACIHVCVYLYVVHTYMRGRTHVHNYLRRRGSERCTFWQGDRLGTACLRLLHIVGISVGKLRLEGRRTLFLIETLHLVSKAQLGSELKAVLN